jgi:hypothetical protein
MDEPVTEDAPAPARSVTTGEVFVTRTVVARVAGSGIEFAYRGEHELKGVPSRRRLFAVQLSEPVRRSDPPTTSGVEWPWKSTCEGWQ